jgi:hypothetical protein
VKANCEVAAKKPERRRHAIALSECHFDGVMAQCQQLTTEDGSNGWYADREHRRRVLDSESATLGNEAHQLLTHPHTILHHLNHTTQSVHHQGPWSQMYAPAWHIVDSAARTGRPT